MKLTQFAKWMTLTAVAVTLGGSAQAAGVKLANDDGYIKLGGRIQLQYHLESPDDGEEEDELFFRRFRPYIEGSVHDDWKGKFQFDFGKGSSEIKDAYLAYGGIDGLSIKIGNAVVPFSRERLTSSKKQQLVERTFTGDHNYGVPDRSPGVHLGGSFGDGGEFSWGAALVTAAVDADDKKLDFDSTASLNRGDDWTEGIMYAARVEFAPLGAIKYEQTDFKNTDLKVAIGVGAFGWDNDKDALQGDEEDEKKHDVDSSTGFNVGMAVRFMGASVDAEFNSADADLVTAGVDNGIYAGSSTTLESFAIEGGYLIAGQVEAIYGFESLDADGYSEAWTRNSVGVNYYFEKHDIKLSTTYRINADKDGKAGNDVDELFVQMQYVF